jgi:fatty acid desaturase
LYVWEQQATTRSCRYPGILGELLVLNFNLHTEHHLFPALPWFRLREARKLIKPALTPGYNEVHGIGWNYDMRTGDLDHFVEPNYIPSGNSESERQAGGSRARRRGRRSEKSCAGATSRA